MDYKQELLGTSFRKAKSTLLKIDELGITPDMSEEEVENTVIALAEAKALLLADGTKPSKLVGGYEWYVASLIKKSALSKEELLQAEYDELSIDNSDFAELSAML